MNTDWNSEIFPNPAGFWPRLQASFLDAVIVLLPLFIIQWTIQTYTEIDVYDSLMGEGMLLYNLILHWKFGATIGKKMMKIRVETKNSHKISFFQSILRESISILSSIVFFILCFTEDNAESSNWTIYLYIHSFITLADVLFIPFTDNKQALHDIISGTYCRIK